MRDVYISSDNILSPIGLTTAKNFAAAKQLVAGVKKHSDNVFSDVPFYASLFKETEFTGDNPAEKGYSKFEKMLIASISDALQNSYVITSDKKTALIISTTKGNISLLETAALSKELQSRVSLTTSAKLVADYFHFTSKPIIISNACISGLLAIITGMRLIQTGQYDHAVVAGADVISKFVLSGFQAFQAISDDPCKPFDVSRKGINLGEAAGTIILSADKNYSQGIKVSSGAISNDANHISGPSRTGEELNAAITKALSDAGLSAAEIDLISAHGTATLYNDEMEAKAITLAHMQHVPVNSLKGYFGHTLGAAGIIESVMSVASLKENIVLPTLGFSEIGVTTPVNVCSNLYHTPLKSCLKTASGFGGCNAAVVLGKQ